MLGNLLKNSVLALSKQATFSNCNGINLQFVRALPHFVDKPTPGEIIKNISFHNFLTHKFSGKNHMQYRRAVHYPEDKK